LSQECQTAQAPEEVNNQLSKRCDFKRKKKMDTVQNTRQKVTLRNEENVLANGVKQCRTNSVPYLGRKPA
jgi:hypothetical protein